MDFEHIQWTKWSNWFLSMTSQIINNLLDLLALICSVLTYSCLSKFLVKFILLSMYHTHRHQRNYGKKLVFFGDSTILTELGKFTRATQESIQILETTQEWIS